MCSYAHRTAGRGEERGRSHTAFSLCHAFDTASTAARIVRMASPGSLAPRIAVPATITLAPCLAASTTVVQSTPPSTSMSREGYL
jgi:hypothetical protein